LNFYFDKMVAKKKMNESSVFSPISEDPLKSVLSVMEKKSRNLEKRKVKLDGYRLVVKQGGCLDPDQKAAVDKYDEVVGALNITKDLLKAATAACTEIHKNNLKLKCEQEEEKLELKLKSCQNVISLIEMFKLISLDEKIKMDLYTPKSDETPILSIGEVEMIVDFYKKHLELKPEQNCDVIRNSNQIGEKVHLVFLSSTDKLELYSYADLFIVYQKLVDSGYFKALPALFTVKNKDYVDDLYNIEDKKYEVVEDDLKSDGGLLNKEGTFEFLMNEETSLTDKRVFINKTEVNPEVVTSNQLDANIGKASSVNNEENLSLNTQKVSYEEKENEKEEESNERSIKDILAEVHGDYFKTSGFEIEFEVSPSPPPTEHVQKVDALLVPVVIPTYNGIDHSAVIGKSIETSVSAMNISPVSLTQPGIFPSSTPQVSDSLGMGETTFGSFSVAGPMKQRQENIYQPAQSFHIHPELHKSSSIKNADSVPLNVPLQLTPEATQMSSIMPVLSVPDPPKAIPMPNEEASYKPFNTNINSSQDINDGSSKPTQDEAVLHIIRQSTSRRPTERTAPLPNDNSHIVPIVQSNAEAHYCSNGGAEEYEDQNPVTALKEHSEPSVTGGSGHINSKPNEVNGLLRNENSEVGEKGDQLSVSDNAARMNRATSNYNNNPNFNNKNNTSYRQNPHLHCYFPRGNGNNSNYRSNPRGYNNFDNRNHGGNYPNLNSYPSYGNRAQDGNMYYPIRRGGNPNPNRGGRTGNLRGGRPYNRTRTFRTQSNEQTFNN